MIPGLPHLSSYSLCLHYIHVHGEGKPGNVQFLQLNGWDGIRVKLGLGHGIVSGNISRNTCRGIQFGFTKMSARDMRVSGRNVILT